MYCQWINFPVFVACLIFHNVSIVYFLAFFWVAIAFWDVVESNNKHKETSSQKSEEKYNHLQIYKLLKTLRITKFQSRSFLISRLNSRIPVRASMFILSCVTVRLLVAKCIFVCPEESQCMSVCMCQTLRVSSCTLANH